ncbi:MAG: tetratricopeptide repeat protein, partial [Myxococcota bacterium]
PGIAVVAAIAVAGWWISQRPAPAPALPAPEVAAPVEVPAPVPVTPEPPPPPVVALGPIETMTARVGAVEEPRALLVARAWTARLGGDRDGAVRLAERAVARSPEDPEALALLAELYVEADQEPDLARELRRRAQQKGPQNVAASRAMARIAWTQGRVDAALAEAERCVSLAPDDVGCRAVNLAVTEGGRDPANVLYAYDELAKAWPANRELARRGALLAVAADAGGAEDRVAAARKLLPKDEDLKRADAKLRMRVGDLDGALSLLGVPSPNAAPDGALDAAAILVAKGDGAGARAWLDALPEPGRAESRARYRLLAVQARLLLARADASRSPEVAAAAAALADLGGRSAAEIQAKVLAATFAGGDVAAAWTAPDPEKSPRRDVARAWLARAAAEVAAGRPPEALSAAEEAVKADPSDPTAHLWKTQALLLAQNGNGAMAALRAAVAAVDGQAARRSPVDAALPVPAPAHLALDKLGAGDLALRNQRALAEDVIAWLRGGSPSLDPSDVTEAELHALRARVRLARGDAAGALVEIEKAAAMQPRQAAWHVVRAQAQVALGRWSDAERSLETIRSAGHRTPIVSALRAQVAKARKSPAAALDAAREAVAADPADVVARRLLRELD